MYTPSFGANVASSFGITEKRFFNRIVTAELSPPRLYSAIVHLDPVKFLVAKNQNRIVGQEFTNI